MNKRAKFLAISGIVASLYIVLSLITFPVASGAIQFRLSEGLTLLPLVMPQSIIGLFIGCALSNLITGCMVLDIILGSIITLVAGVLTYLTGKIIKKMPLKIFVGGLFPVLLNAIFLPLIWIKCYGVIEYMYPIQVAFLVISQSLSIYLVGTIIVLKLQVKVKN